MTGSGPALAGASFGRWCILSLYVPGGRGRKRDRTEGLPVVRWQAQGCALRSPQQIVCRRRAGSPAAVAAHKCFATLALVLPFARRRTYQLSIWAKKRDDRPKTRKRDCTSRGQSTRRHDRRRVFAGLLVAPVFLLEGNSVTARLILRRPLGYLWRLWSGSHFAQSIRPTTPRHACTTILSVTTTPAKPTLSTNCTGAGHNAGQLGRACVSAQAIGLPWPSGDAIGLARLTANEFDEEAADRAANATRIRSLGQRWWSLTPDGWLR